MASIVASLVFVGLQLRQSQELGISEIMSNMSDRKTALHELITDHAEVWHKACGGEELDPAARIIAGRIFMALIGDSISEYVAYETGIIRSESRQQRVIEQLAAEIWLYPGLRQMAESHGDRHYGAVEATGTGFGEGFGKRLVERLEELDSGQTAPSVDTIWCGSV